MEDDFCIIESLNYYTFIDNIDNYEIDIFNFFHKDREYERIVYYKLDKWLLITFGTF